MRDQDRTVKGVTLGNGRYIGFMETMPESRLHGFLIKMYLDEYRIWGVKQIHYSGEDGAN